MSEQLKTQEHEEELKDKFKTLKEKGIVSFAVELTPEERESVKEIRIEKELPQFNYYGPANEDLAQQLGAYLQQLEGNTREVLETIAGLVAKVVKKIQRDFNKESAWVMMRVTVPNHNYDIPRWHRDGSYVTSEDEIITSPEKEYKLVFTVKGAPTRFAEIVDTEKYKQLEQEGGNNWINYNNNPSKYKEEDIRIRENLMLTVKETESINKDQAVLYLVGDEDAKVHSEPPMDTPRIFMAAIFGSAPQIEEFKERYEK